MGERVSDTIDYLLQSKDSRFDIIVLDNCSNDNSYDFLKTKKSDRVIVRQNDKNIGATLNYIASLQLSNAKYCMTLLDKDTLDIEVLSEFIDFLDKEDNLFGYCELNYDKNLDHQYIRYKAGIESLSKMAYLSKHPTGYFYNTRILQNVLEEDFFKEMDYSIPFPYEIINAHLSLKYDSCWVKLPLCYPEARSANKTKSMSYNEENLFYAPRRRTMEYKSYLSDLVSLDIDNKELTKLFYKLYRSLLSSVSHAYMKNMKDPFLCEHYNVRERAVPFYEQVVETIKAASTSYFILNKRIGMIPNLYIISKGFIINLAYVIYYLILK